MSAGEIIKNTVVPILGGIFAVVMFASPAQAVFKARNRGAIGSLNPLPFVMAMANCVAWMPYAFLTDDWYLIVPNALGCLIATFLFLLSYGLGMPDRRSRDQLSLVFMVLTVVLFVVSILERMAITSLDTKKQLWGYTANLILVFYFLSPLSTLLKVLRNRDSSSLVLALSVMVIINGLLWSTYGIVALDDPFVWAPNVFGTFLGVVQVILKLTIPSTETQSSNDQFNDLPLKLDSDLQTKTNGAAIVPSRSTKDSAPQPATSATTDTILTLDEPHMFRTSSDSPGMEASAHGDHPNDLWLPFPVAAADISTSNSSSMGIVPE